MSLHEEVLLHFFEERFKLKESIFVQEAIRRATIANKFVPVFMGSAFKNKVENILSLL